jgi:serine/threonine protein kinase
VPIYDAFDADGRLAIALRYVDGTDLKQLLREEHRLDVNRALAICGQVAAALDSRSRARTRSSGREAVERAARTKTSTPTWPTSVSPDASPTLRGSGDERLSVGTPDYASPEQIEQRQADGRADECALACLLFECLTGEPPFPRDSELAFLWAHVQEEPPAASEHNPDLPIAIDAVIGKAMSKSLDDRYRTCGEFVEAARDARSACRSSSSPASMACSCWRWRRR